MLAADPFDVLVSDIGMPEQDGYAPPEHGDRRLRRDRLRAAGGAVAAHGGRARGEARSRRTVARMHVRTIEPLRPRRLEARRRPGHRMRSSALARAIGGRGGS